MAVGWEGLATYGEEEKEENGLQWSAFWTLGGLSLETCTGWGKARPRPHH